MQEELTLLQAINAALFDALTADQSVVIFGEDVGKNGGVFRATDHLQTHFGTHRVFDTPLAEALIAGLALGMSTHGLRPVAEFQFMGFIYAAFEQIISHIARMRNRTRGRLSCPLVLRAPYCAGIHAPEHHSESTEALFAHIPGLRVVIPSSPEQAYGLLRAAIAHPDPVLFLEPKRIYHSIKQAVDRQAEWPDLSLSHRVCIGTDLTLIAWGAMLAEARQATIWAQSNNISIELIDLVSIKPLDIDTILSSVQKTGRCLIVHEAARTCGVGAEISARVQEQAWDTLLAPIMRLTGYDTVMPYSKLEHLYLPNHHDIIGYIQKLMEYPE